MVKNKNRYFGECPVCKMPDKNLATTKTSHGPIRYTTVLVCDHCSIVIGLEIDHVVRILQADTFEARMKINKDKREKEKEKKC